jgi:uncharacterized protein with ParB-like and HNH nuclease domain
MKANEINLNRFLSQADTQFIIPVYQRNYDWAQSHCKQLLDDILRIGNSKENEAHFIGSIVYIHDDVYTTVKNRARELTIIDGQQRLTTITLIYLAIYRLAQELKDSGLSNRINETYLINKFIEDEEKLKLRPTDNNDRALKYLLNNRNGGLGEYSRLLDNFDYLRTRITKENYEVVLNGLSGLMFVEISLERKKDDPQRIFESLNSTGLELSQADLIRNYILMGLDRKSQNNIYDNYWEIIEINAKDSSTNKSMVSDYIRDYLTVENKKIPNKNKVYFEFKNKFPTTTVSNLESFLEPIRRLSFHYKKLIKPEAEEDQQIRCQIEYINKLEIKVAYPFLIKVYEDYDNATISKETFIEILELIQSFTWRRFIIGLPTNALNKIFMSLYDNIDKSDYLYSIQKTLYNKKGTQRFPRDNEVIYSLKEKDMYFINTKNREYFLERLENYGNKEPVDIYGNDNITVEHIFPQTPDTSWKIELNADEYNTIKDKYVNTISNLTLSGNNGSLKNKAFIEKRDMNVDGKEQGYKFSRLWLNRYLSTIDKWSIEEIEERFEIIKNRFLQIWKIPAIENDVQIDFDEVSIFDADEPTGKKLEYAIFFDSKLDYIDVTKLYIEVVKTLFEIQPETFFTTDLGERIVLTDNPDVCRKADRVNERYYIETNLDSRTKFERIKYALSIFDCEDELVIKYKE